MEVLNVQEIQEFTLSFKKEQKFYCSNLTKELQKQYFKYCKDLIIKDKIIFIFINIRSFFIYIYSFVFSFCLYISIPVSLYSLKFPLFIAIMMSELWNYLNLRCLTIS